MMFKCTDIYCIEFILTLLQFLEDFTMNVIKSGFQEQILETVIIDNRMEPWTVSLKGPFVLKKSRWDVSIEKCVLDPESLLPPQSEIKYIMTYVTDKH